MQISWCQITLALFAGYGVSLGLGGLLVWCFHGCMKRNLGEEPKSDKRVSPHVTGLVERLVFTTTVIAQPQSAVVAMGGWLALKMAAAWNKEVPSQSEINSREERLNWISFGFLGLLSGLLSMAFAGTGGALARFLLRLPVIDSWPSNPPTF